MKTKSLGFGEAVRTLAAEAGMQPYKFSNFDKKKDLRFQSYKNIFYDYMYYFNHQLFNSTDQDALDYLLKRGLKKDIINDFQLGYVPWQNNFYNELLKKYSEEEINLTGLYYRMTKQENTLIDLIQNNFSNKKYYWRYNCIWRENYP